MHRNSPKRFYEEGSIYFITTNVENRIPFFKEDLFCELFIENLRLCKQLKDFALYGFVIIPCHVHLLLEPRERFDVSKVMFSIKKQFSHDANRVMGFNKLYMDTDKGEQTIKEGGRIFARLPAKHQQAIIRYQKIVVQYHERFLQKYGPDQAKFPSFQWQQSFYDHVIRNQKDFLEHTRYIFINPQKHNICDDPSKYRWSSTNPEFEDLIDDMR